MRGRRFASQCNRVFATEGYSESMAVNKLEDDVDKVLDNAFAMVGHLSFIKEQREAVQSELNSSYRP